MDKYIHLSVFLLAIVHIVFDTDWFIRVALAFLLYSAINFFSEKKSRRCKTAVIAAVLLFLLARGVPWFPVLPLTGLLLAMAVYP